MQTTDRAPLIAFCLLLAFTDLYACFLCFRLVMGQDVRPDVAVWSILATLVLLGASAARNSALRARASRARWDYGPSPLSTPSDEPKPYPSDYPAGLFMRLRRGDGISRAISGWIDSWSVRRQIRASALAKTAYGRLGDAGTGERRFSTGADLTMAVASAHCAGHALPLLRRAGEVSPDTWTSEDRDARLQLSDRQLIQTARNLASGLSYNDDRQAPVKHVLYELAMRLSATTAPKTEAGPLAAELSAAGPIGAEVHADDDETEKRAFLALAERRYGPDSPFVQHLRGEAEGEDEASFVTPPRMPGDGDEMLVQIVEELDDMLGEAISDPEGIAPASWRDIGRTWRDLCQALGVVQPTYAHQAPDHWDATPEHDYDDAIEAAGPAMHEAAGG